jgi:hypothetical protein
VLYDDISSIPDETVAVTRSSLPRLWEQVTPRGEDDC